MKIQQHLLKIMKKSRRECFTLLEVLIALLLVLMCLPILISSFVFINIEQQKMLNQMGLSQVANNAFAVVLEEMVTNKISYNFLEGDRTFPLEPRHFESDKPLNGSFFFKKLDPEKPNKENYKVELWQVTIELEPPYEKKAFSFAYKFIVIRDFSHLGGAQDEKK
ncbi:hypothetical protein PHSC3_000144 [Chlamydiales bacterium STE3]|nr:hypothetical protein PHSC3_000144 [Chlamydiales bacterium STE3]